MSKFYVPKRYDENVADAGVEFEIRDAFDNFYGAYTLRLIDPTSARGKLDDKRLVAKYGKLAKTGKLTQFDIMRLQLVEHSLTAWRLPVDPSAKKAEPVPLTHENAMEYFKLEETQWIVAELHAKATDYTNYSEVSDKAALAEEADAAEKN